MTVPSKTFNKFPIRRTRRAMAILLFAPLLAVGTATYAQEPINGASRAHAEGLSVAFRNASNRAKPAVVKIITKTKARVERRQVDNPFRGTPFEDFFGDEFGGGFGGFRIPERQGLGSGVIIDPDGVVLTNNHVVAGADEVTVQLPDGREFLASDPKTDSDTDLAVLRIDISKSPSQGQLPFAKLGDSDKLEVGDWVLAIGTPFEYEQTVTAGIISGKGRQVGGIRRARFLQTDAAINPGNSGGPLVNLDGEVVGINTAIATSSGGYQGIGFAIPVNLAKWVVPQLLEKGAVQRAFLGVGVENLNSDLSQYFNVRVNSGALIAQVYPGSPAAEAGLEPGDVIQSFNGTAVGDAGELTSVVERAPLGRKLPIQIVRDGASRTMSVVLRPYDESTLAGQESATDGLRARAGDSFEASELGLTVVELTPDAAQQQGFGDLFGVVIASVEPNSAAAEAGLRRGMVIIRVGRKTVRTVEDFRSALATEFRFGRTAMLARVTPQANQWFNVEKPE